MRMCVYSSESKAQQANHASKEAPFTIGGSDGYAEDRLASLLGCYGITVNPNVLRLVLKAEWLRIAALAHAIHDGA